MNPDQEKNPRRLLSISTDRLLFVEGSAVYNRFLEYGKQWDEIHVIVAAGKDFKETAIAPNVWAYPTRSAIKVLYPLDAIRLGRLIVNGRGITDITCQDPFFTAIAGFSLKKSFGLPLELQVHTDIGSPSFAYSPGNKIRKAMALSYLPKADSIRAVSGRIERYLTGVLKIPKEKVTVRPIFVDTEAIKAAPVGENLHEIYPQFEKIALVASRFEPEKNIGLAVRSWVEVLKKAPKAGLILVGAGSQEQGLRNMVANLAIGGSVIFEPWADRAKLISYYKTADLFLNPSLFEGYGMSMVEANAAGCKVVSTSVGVAIDIGATVAGWDAKSFSDGIIQALGVY